MENKTHRCPYGCGKSFSQWNGMNAHVRAAHENIVYPCPYKENEGCKAKDFKQKRSLNGHIAKKHKGEEGKTYKCPDCPKKQRTKGCVSLAPTRKRMNVKQILLLQTELSSTSKIFTRNTSGSSVETVRKHSHVRDPPEITINASTSILPNRTAAAFVERSFSIFPAKTDTRRATQSTPAQETVVTMDSNPLRTPWSMRRILSMAAIKSYTDAR
ncbi:hypothetical protein LB503_005906 [Fusarium chuoi]|nr:hypothetical protein LB503_005906 [Fusarium chuoi]